MGGVKHGCVPLLTLSDILGMIRNPEDSFECNEQPPALTSTSISDPIATYPADREPAARSQQVQQHNPKFIYGAMSWSFENDHAH